MTTTDTDLVVRDVTVRAVVVPMRRPLATRVGEFARWPLVLVDLATEQGITGRGYLAPYRPTAAAALLPVLRDLAAGLRGRPAAPVRVGPASAADDVAAVRGVRAAVGDDVTLVVDYNQGLSLGEALTRCGALDAEGIDWIEEPLRYDDLDGHARLAARRRDRRGHGDPAVVAPVPGR